MSHKTVTNVCAHSHIQCLCAAAQDPSGTSEFKPMDGVVVEWEREQPAAAAAAEGEQQSQQPAEQP